MIKTIIVGAGKAGVFALDEIRSNTNSLGFEIVGFIDDKKSKYNTVIDGIFFQFL